MIRDMKSLMMAITWYVHIVSSYRKEEEEEEKERERERRRGEVVLCSVCTMLTAGTA